MPKEVTVTDIELDSILAGLEQAGTTMKGERFVYYPSTNEANNRSNAGGIIRIEDEKGLGFQVGIVVPAMGNFGRGSVVMTTFNSSPGLMGLAISHMLSSQW